MPTPPASVGTSLASFLIKAVWPKLKRQLLGEPEQRALQDAAREAITIAVDRVAPTTLDATERQHLVWLLEQTLVLELDRATAGTSEDTSALVEGAGDPIEAIRQRFLVLGYDPNTIGVDFDQLAGAFIAELPDALRRAASRHGSAIFEMITQEHLAVIAGALQRIARSGDRHGRCSCSSVGCATLALSPGSASLCNAHQGAPRAALARGNR